MEESKCLPGVMKKCPDCDGPECTYAKGSRCEEDNLSYLPPTLRQELMAYRDTGLTPEVLKEFAPFLDEMRKSLGAMRRLKELTEAERAGRLVVLPADKAWWLKAILDERERQDQKWGFPQENTYGEWGSILAEEAGELCKELNELNFGSGDPGKMETEAVQVAAVALSILEHAAVALGVTEQVAEALGRLARKEAEAAVEGDATQ